MSADACSIVRSIPKSVWAKKPEPVPAWISNLAKDIVLYAKIPSFYTPKIAVTSVPCKSHFAGRWFQQINGVAVALQPSETIIRGVLVHEMGHWLSWIRNGDEPGEHDERFYEIMRDLYPTFHVSLQTAKTIDHHSQDLVAWR